jgi:uncharacterized protein (TIGR04255 family)
MAANTEPGLDRPPIFEAVVGVVFAPLSLSLVRLAQSYALWSEEFPATQDAPPLPPVIPAGQGPAFQIGLVPGGLSTRYLFVSASGEYLLQLQNDRLLLNWRKVDNDSEYPGYGELRKRFVSLLQRFDSFASDSGVGPIRATSTEFTYFNRIKGRPDYSIFSIFQKLPSRVPGDAAYMQFSEVRNLLSLSGIPGQVNIACEPILNAGDPEMQLSIATRHFSASVPFDEHLIGLIDEGHAASRETFFGLTTDSVQEGWGRR